jgi:hypothetical protein
MKDLLPNKPHSTPFLERKRRNDELERDEIHLPRLGAGRTFFQPTLENFLASLIQFGYPGAEFEDCSGGNSRPSCLSGVGGGNFLG